MRVVALLRSGWRTAGVFHVPSGMIAGSSTLQVSPHTMPANSSPASLQHIPAFPSHPHPTHPAPHGCLPPQGGMGRIRSNLASRVKKGKMSQVAADAAMGRVVGTLEYALFSSVDMVIEAVIEDIGLKQRIFADLEKHCRWVWPGGARCMVPGAGWG